MFTCSKCWNFRERERERERERGGRNIIIPPANEVAGVYSDPYVRPFVRLSVRPSQSLIRYSSKTAEHNFMKLSGIVHYMMSYCTSYFKFLFEWFWGSQTKTRTLPYKTWGSGGYHFVSIAYSISSYYICDITWKLIQKC